VRLPDANNQYFRQYPQSLLYIGVTITNNLSFETHINNIVSKARQRISTLFRGFITRNLYIMRRAFITYIRPIVKYVSIRDLT
jgi:hypothetical protein